jgi:hypothetical protein
MLSNPVVLRHAIEFDENTEYYQLPPSIGEIWRVALRNEDGMVVDEVVPRNEFHPHGVGWAIEGNTLRFDPKQKAATKQEHLEHLLRSQWRCHAALLECGW